ncbi:MAG: sterol desaturase family protein [Alphaproteobacteria bacterium]|nr:sterol desaturase family protein [Alphaproteobacteria bacterium]
MLSLEDFLMIFGAGAVLLALERLFPLHPEQKSLRQGWKVDVLHIFLSGTLIRLGATLAILTASVLALSVVPEPVRNFIRAQPDWLEFIELLILSDLCFYLAHRISHAVPILWRFHAVHHSSEHLDWLATYRVHPVDQVLNSTMIALPAIVLGFSPIPLLIYAIIYRIHAPLLHSNIKFDLGPLGLVFTSPRFHHWHHADQENAYDRNFGGQLSIFDGLFGTHNKAGEGTLPARYGIGGAIPETYVSHLLQPFQMARGAKDKAEQTTPVDLGADRPSPTALQQRHGIDIS